MTETENRFNKVLDYAKDRYKQYFPENQEYIEEEINVVINKGRGDCLELFDKQMQTFDRRLPWMDLMKKYHSDNPKEVQEAKNKAIELQEKFIWDKIWKKYSSYVPNEKEALYHEGVLGVLEGLQNYNPHISMPTTHMAFYVSHRLTKHIDEYTRKANTYYLGCIKAIEEAIAKYEERGIQWDVLKIKEATGLDVETIVNSLAIKNGTNGSVSLDSEEYLAHASSEIGKSAEDIFFSNLENEEIAEALSKMPHEQEAAIRLFYGFCSQEYANEIFGKKMDRNRFTKKEIGAVLNIPEGDISNTITRGLKKMKKAFGVKPKKACNDTEIGFIPNIDLDNMTIL